MNKIKYLFDKQQIMTEIDAGHMENLIKVVFNHTQSLEGQIKRKGRRPSLNSYCWMNISQKNVEKSIC